MYAIVGENFQLILKNIQRVYVLYELLPLKSFAFAPTRHQIFLIHYRFEKLQFYGSYILLS